MKKSQQEAYLMRFDKQKLKNKLDKLVEIDVYSRFSESDLEFVHKEDEDNALYLMDSYNEFNQERKYYD